MSTGGPNAVLLSLASYIRDKKDMAPSLVCNLMLSNVRESTSGARNSFEVCSWTTVTQLIPAVFCILHF